VVPTEPPASWTKSCASARSPDLRVMRALYFGTYDRSYPRNAQVISALRGAGVEVVEQHRPVWERRHNWSVGLRQMLRLAEAERSLRHATDNSRTADVLIVGYPGHFDLPAARRVARGRPVVFNPLVSLHDTLVDDRGRFRPGSPAAGVVRLVDRRAFQRADVVVADTEAHARFFRGEFGLDEDKVSVCLVGAEDRLFRPGRQRDRPFHALFVGKLIPLHGLETILGAAALAPEITFRIVGSGQLEPLLEKRPPNAQWLPWVEYERLPAEIQSAGCALGVFGTGAKATRVIPNKAFQALACATPLVTADTPAARELLTHGEDALLVPPGDAVALAAAVRHLAADTALAARIGAAGRETYEAQASEIVLGERWRGVLERAIAAA
jgi:glycosyltransferase involved in cell wall biosynthesis